MRIVLLLVCVALLWLGALLAVLTWPLRALIAPRAPSTKETLRLLDHLTNVAWFGGDWWASLSAQSWQVRRAWLVAALDLVEPQHCAEAFRREADVMNFFDKRK